MFRHLFTYLILSLLTLPLLGQDLTSAYNYRLSNLNTNRGLSSATVQDILQTPDGAIWISTKLGVDRYNGQVVHNYTLPQVGKTAQSNFKMLRLFLDADQHLYIYDNKGYLFRYVSETDDFVLVHDLNTLLGVEVILNQVLPDGQQGYWLALREGLCHLTAQGEIVWLEQGTNIRHINFFGDHLLSGSDLGVFSYTPDGSQHTQLTGHTDLQSSLFDPQTGILWLGTFHSGVIAYDTRQGRQCPWTSLHQVPTTPIRTLAMLDDKSLLIGNDGSGVFIARRDGSHIAPLFDDTQSQLNALKGKGIYDICVDHEGNLWMGSYTGGVDIAIAADNLFETVQHIDNNTNSLIHDNVNDILQTTDGSLWYATEGGLSIYTPDTRQWRHTLRDIVVLSLCQTRQGELLAGTYGNGVYRVTADGRATPLYTVQNGMLQSNFVFRVHEDVDGSLWVGCLDGPMAHINEGHATFYPITVVQCIGNMPGGDLAVGTAYGWYRIHQTDPQTSDATTMRPTTQLFTHGDFPTQDYNYSIESILFASDDEAWLGTDGGGIYLFRLSTHEVLTNITSANGLPSDYISSLVYDYRGNILVSTDRGLAIISSNDVTVNNISYAQELEAPYNHMAFEPLSDGRLAFGSANGATIIDPERLGSLPYEAHLRITGLSTIGSADSESAAWREELHHMINEGTVRLANDQNTFDIFFESICFAYQHDIHYQYLMEGYDKAWSPLSVSQRAHYANLPSGRYTLQVRSVSQNNGRQLDHCQLTIIVSRPWWYSHWAWLCYITLLAIVSYFCFRYIRERRKRQEFDRKINFFLHTAHDIRTPLSLIKAPLDNIGSDTTLSDESRQYLQMARNGCDELQQMVTRLMNIQKSDNWNAKAQLTDISLAALLDMQVQRFMALAQQKHIDLQLHNATDQITLSADQAMTDSILENLLSNAMKYTPEGGTVTVSVESDSAHVRILVSDSGIGIPQSDQKHIFQSFYRARNAFRQNGTGLGLVYSRRLAELQHGSLTFTSQEGQGTTFTLTLLRGNDITTPAITPLEATEADTLDTLLFVDDSPQLRQYMQMAFRETFHVVTAERAEQALEYLSQQHADILISDVMMPGLHGDQLCRQLKDNPETAWLPIILLSANVDRNSMVGGLDAGADDYVAKPFDIDLLRHRIDRLLANRRRMSQYYMKRSLELVKGKPEPGGQTVIETPAPEPQDTGMPSVPALNAADEAFIEKATQLVLDNLTDVDYNIDKLCSDMAMSRTLFYGRIKSLTSQTPQEFIRLIRLERAAALIREGKPVLEVSIESGFVNVKYFSTLFKKHFGVSPSKFQ